MTFEESQLTSLAQLVHKNGGEYLSTLKDSEDAEFDPAKFVETFSNDVRAKISEVKKNQYGRGQAEVGKALKTSVMSLVPELALESSDVNEVVAAMDSYYKAKLSAAQELAGNSKTFEELSEDELKSHPSFQEAWRKQSEDYQNKIQAREKELEAAKVNYETQVAKSALTNMRDSLRSFVVANAGKLRIKLADPADEPSRYARQIETILREPEFHPSLWKRGEGGQLLPFTPDGIRRQNKDFHDVNASDVLALANPFGVRKYDDKVDSPSPGRPNGSPLGKMDFPEYTKRLRVLKSKGDKAGIAELSKLYKSQVKG